MGTIGDKLTYLNGTKELIKRGLNNLGGGLTNEPFRDYVDVLDDIYDKFPKVTGTGEEVELETIAGLMDVDVLGKTEQTQLSGKNHANPSNLIDGSFTTNSQIVNNTNYDNVDEGKYRILRLPNLPAGTYTVHIIWQNTARIIRKYSDGNTQSIALDQNEYTFTTQNDGLFAIQFRNSTTTAFTNDDFKIQLELGSTATEYEPYCGLMPSPNPSYPQEIQNVEGTLGKNLYNKFGDFNYPTNKFADRTVLQENGTIKTTANYRSNISRGIRLPNLKANTIYVVSGKLISSTAVGTNYKGMIQVRGYSNDWVVVATKYMNTLDNFSFTFNTGDYTDFFVSLNTSGSDLYATYESIYDNIQVEEGSTATEYEPYKKAIEIKVNNKNLFDSENFERHLVSGKILNDNGVEVSDSTSEYSTYKIAVKANEELHFKGWFQKIYIYDKNQNLISRSTSYDGATTSTEPNFSITTSIDGYIGIQIFKSHYNENKGNEQIEKGSIATTYEEHKEQTVVFPLNGQKLMEGDYLADDGVHHVKGQAIYDGTENWQAYTEKNTASYYCYWVATPSDCIVSHDVTGLLLANLLKEGTWDNIYAKRTDTQIIALRDNGRFYIRTLHSTVEALKTFLATRNLQVEYTLAEEVIDSYTTEQQTAYNQLKSLMSYENYTYVYTETEGLHPILNVTALAAWESLIQ